MKSQIEAEIIKVTEHDGAKDLNASSEVSKLLHRKDELEQIQKMREKYNERLQVSVNLLIMFLILLQHQIIMIYRFFINVSKY